jgi:dienelactone hydrolase
MPRRARGTVLRGSVLAFLLCTASMADSAELFVDGVPIPEDAAIAAAPPGAPDAARRFLGAWVGSWDDLIKAILIVEEVRADGTARVAHAIGDYAPFNRKSGVWRQDAILAGDTLTFTVSGFTTTYTLADDDTIAATFQGGLLRSNARLSRHALADLKRSGAAIAWSKRIVAFLPTALTEDGKPVRLEAAMFRPDGAGPFPLLVINHGSTGRGNDPALFGQTRWSFAIADLFTRKGWLVAFPQRRGRGNSDGRYDEGFGPDRAQGYTCEPVASLAGADRALDDVRAAMLALRSRPDVDGRRVLVGGISRGGVLSIAYAGEHPDEVLGVINFVGGWLGTGCGTAAEINGALFARGGRFRGPTLWLYGRDDPFYPIGHSRTNFAAFESAGGKGEFFAFDVPGKNGHALNAYPELWVEQVEKFVSALEAAEKKP